MTPTTRILISVAVCMLVLGPALAQEEARQPDLRGLNALGESTPPLISAPVKSVERLLSAGSRVLAVTSARTVVDLQSGEVVQIGHREPARRLVVRTAVGQVVGPVAERGLLRAVVVRRARVVVGRAVVVRRARVVVGWTVVVRIAAGSPAAEP